MKKNQTITKHISELQVEWKPSTKKSLEFGTYLILLLQL